MSNKNERKVVGGTTYEVVAPQTHTNKQIRAINANKIVAAHNTAQALLPIERRVMKQYVAVPQSLTYRRLTAKLGAKSLESKKRKNPKKLLQEYLRFRAEQAEARAEGRA